MAEDERENAMHVIAVDAMGGDNAPQAIVEGVNQAIACLLYTSKLLEMTQLNSSSNVKVGTEVVTSGLDDVSVKDVPIGTVDSVIDYEGNRTILVKPYADFDKISYVTLVGDGK